MITLGEGLHSNIAMETYHDNCCPGPSVSGSTLWTLHDSCPAKAQAQHYLGSGASEDEPEGEDETEAKAFGTIAHTYLIEGKEAFNARYAVKPDGMNFSTKEGKAWKAEHADRQIVTFKVYEKITGMALGIAANPAAHSAFSEGEPEVTAVVQDPETKLWLKARPDYLRPGLAINYKTTRNASRERWMRDAWNLGYSVSAALCVDVLKALGHDAHYAFITQEKVPPYLCAVRVLSDDFLQGGRMIYRRALQRFADCLAADKWPGFADGVETIPLPPWADRTLANMESPT